MSSADVLVGSIAILGGLFCLLGAIQNRDWYYRFWLARLVDSRWGRGRARLFYVGLGCGLIALGITIATGCRVASDSTSTQTALPRFKPQRVWTGIPVGDGAPYGRLLSEGLLQAQA